MALVVNASPMSARADAAGKARSIELYRQSVEKYRAGQFKEAAALLREAYVLEPDPVLLYNLGRACEGMADDACAVDAYERYLAAASPPDRGAIEQKIAVMKARLAAPPAKTKEKEKEPPKEPAPEPRAASPWPWLVTGLGVATLGTGAALGLVARARHNDAADDPVQASAARTQDSAQSTMRAANVLLIVGGVVATTGITWLVLDQRRASATTTTARIGVGPGSVWLTVEF